MERKTIINFQTSWIVNLMIVTIASFLIITGCTTENTELTNPNPGTLNPTGTIQGRLVDSVTQEPIVGAVIDIGVGKATTSETGQFTIRDVPATASSGDGIPVVTGNYVATIDLRNVSDPVNMKSETETPRYPDFSYDFFTVTYTSLNDTTNDSRIEGDTIDTDTPTNTETNTTSTNHDTPVTGLVAGKQLSVGKLAATITGVVAYDTTKQTIGEGWTVKLVSKGSFNSDSGDQGTGDDENIVGSTTTDASGAFTFANIESLQFFEIRAWNSAQTYMTTGTGVSVTAPADGETLVLTVQKNNAVFVVSTDILAPAIISVSPENNADITAGPVSVVFTFSEPIKQTAYASSITSSNRNGLYYDVQVKYNGIKAGNVAHTLSWNADYTALTVSIPTTATSSRYTVQLTEDANDNSILDVGEGEDTNSNGILDEVNLVDSSDESVDNLSHATEPDKGIVSFTTNGGATASAPTVTLTNSSSINYHFVDPALDWNPVSGAKSYNVYRAMNQVWGSTSNSGAYALITNVNVSNYTDTTIPDNDADGYDFIEDQATKLTYSYYVTSVNSDYTESAGSTAVTAEDKVAPRLDMAVGTFVADLQDGNSSLTVSFDEPVDEALAETASNYSITVASGFPAPTVSTAVYSLAAPYNVELTLSGNLTQDTLGRTISTGTNGFLQSALGAGDTYLYTSNQTAITAGVDTVRNSIPCDTDGNGVADGACDDTIIGTTISSGPNGVVETVKLTASDDVQALSYSANVAAIRGMNTTLSGDDQVTNSVVVTVSNVTDVAGNVVDSNANEQNTAGAVQ